MESSEFKDADASPDYSQALDRLQGIIDRYVTRYTEILEGHDPVEIEAFVQFVLIEGSEPLVQNREMREVADLEGLHKATQDMMSWPARDVRRYFDIFIRKHYVPAQEERIAPAFSLN